MNSITKTYLTDIIYKKVTETIDVHRACKSNTFYPEHYPPVTDEELLDFIFSIPYFDLRLKDFLLGNLAEETIIISQSWEIEFIKKVQLWATSNEWLHEADNIIWKTNLKPNNNNLASFLTLPY